MTLKLVALDIDGTVVGPDFVLPEEMPRGLTRAGGKLQAAGVAALPTDFLENGEFG